MMRRPKSSQADMVIADRAARAKAAMPQRDPTGYYHAQIPCIAERDGVAPIDLLDYWDERAAIREYVGGASRADAEAGAFEDVRARFSVQMEIQ